MERIKGFDTLRFFLALWVLFGHFGFIPLKLTSSAFLGQLFKGVYNNAFSGPAAVIVFFVISGFCIHYPYREGAKLWPASYFARRYIRILAPMLLAIIISVPLGLGLTNLNNSILWSLLCEEIYYVLYPGLLFASRRVGWTSIIVGAYFCSFAVVCSAPRTLNYASYGPYLNWLLGFPCWLLGCRVADKVRSLRTLALSTGSIWLWRAAAWILSSLCSVLRFHASVGYPWTLGLFALFVYLWLQREVIYHNTHSPRAIFERGGKWSYSIYLTHQHGMVVFALALGSPTGVLSWVASVSFTVLAAYVFYRVAEKPSHELARKVGKRLKLSKQRIATHETVTATD